MRVLSKAFARLKTTLPWVPADTKLSKLDTLRLATSYIAHLRAVLQDEHQVDRSGSPVHPLTLVSSTHYYTYYVLLSVVFIWSEEQHEAKTTTMRMRCGGANS